VAWCGIWCPERVAPPPDAEDDYTHHNNIDGGLEFWFSNAALWYSSTRLELLAGILALLSPEAVHMGTDSASFLRTARMIIAMPQGTPKRPWGLMPDGDLWQIFQHLVVAKGPHAVDISKVKGQVTHDMVRDEGFSLAQKIGNDHSDALATKHAQLSALLR
jgi:chitinase